MLVSTWAQVPPLRDSDALLVVRNREKEVTDSLPVGNRARRAPDGGHPRELPRGGGRADQDDGGSSEVFARETRPESEDNKGRVKPE